MPPKSTSNIQISTSAFTLLELLIVVAIIVVLTALMLPAVSRSKSKAQQIQCVSNLRQLGLGLQNFVTVNHAYPTSYAATNSDNPGLWVVQLQRGGFEIGASNPAFVNEGVWRCPSARWRQDIGTPISYAYNSWGVMRVGNSTNGLGLHGRLTDSGMVPVAESAVVRPSEMMAIGDSFGGGVFFMRNTNLAALERIGFASSRHQSRANVVLCDGHVESPSLKFVFTDASDGALVRWNRDHQPHRDRL